MRKLRIFLLPCHSVLEYDEYKLFTSMGHEVFSQGSYINPGQPHDLKRPPIEGGVYNQQLIDVSQVHHKGNLHPEQVEWADVIIAHHTPEFIAGNWDLFKEYIKKGKKVVWRTIGQSIEQVETFMRRYREEGLLIVRYSPREENIPGYIGMDALCRFVVDDREFNDWNGSVDHAMTVGQSVQQRAMAGANFCNYPVFEQVTRGHKRIVYGPGNDRLMRLWGGVLSYEHLKEAYRDARLFFFTGTQPASYTLGFIEALVTGTPVVAIGPRWADAIFKQNTYEIPDILQSGENGFWSDDVGELQDYVTALLTDYGLAKRISVAGRETGVELFGVETVSRQWDKFFTEYCV